MRANTVVMVDEAGAAEAREEFWRGSPDAPRVTIAMWTSGRSFPWCGDGVVWMPHYGAAHEPDDGSRCAASPAGRCA